MKNKSNEKFIIARRARQTNDYIIKNIENFPNKCTILKNNMDDILNRIDEILKSYV